MKYPLITLVSAFLFAAPSGGAQQPTQPQLKVDSSNRTLTVTATDSVTVEPEVAILHIGFDTQLEDAKAAYADGARTSKTIIAAIKQAGIPENAVRSQSQYLERDWKQQHRFKLTQQWTVKVPPERAAEILDIAVTAGATDSGQIDWAVKDERALEAQALDKTTARAKANAEVVAKGMGVRLGALIYVTNQISIVTPRPMQYQLDNLARSAAPPPPIANPQCSSLTAAVPASLWTGRGVPPTLGTRPNTFSSRSSPRCRHNRRHCS